MQKSHLIDLSIWISIHKSMLKHYGRGTWYVIALNWKLNHVNIKYYQYINKYQKDKEQRPFPKEKKQRKKSRVEISIIIMYSSNQWKWLKK